ncbi:glycosyltransferase, partial [bacterium]|nr:glycosyltransferase [bacterium]
MTQISRSRLTVIVLSYNGLEHLPACLESVRNQSVSDFQLVIVDNGSSDGSIEYIRHEFPEAHLIALDENQKFYQKINTNIQNTTKKFILLLNQDIVIEKECFRNLLETWDNPPEDSLDETISGSAQRPIIGVFPKVTFFDSPGTINAFGVDWFKDCHWRDSRVGLPDIGGFDEPETVFGSI